MKKSVSSAYLISPYPFMQPIEILALALYLISYAGAGLMAIARPAAFRASELRFYASGTPGWDETLIFASGALSFLAVILHLILEQPVLGQLLLYAQSVMFVVLLPMHFAPFFRARMKSTLGGKSVADYRASGWRKLVVSAVMIILPLVLR